MIVARCRVAPAAAAACLARLGRQPKRRSSSSSASIGSVGVNAGASASTARSLAEAYTKRAVLSHLHLSRSADLRCVDLMCEKVGRGCACRLALTLERSSSSLVHLDISHNNLSVLPEALWSCARLETLRIGGNGLKSIPAAISRLRALKELHVSDNALQPSEASVPIASLPRSLRVVALGGNAALGADVEGALFGALRAALPDARVIAVEER